MMKLIYDGHELSWAAVLHHGSPQTLSTNSVKGLGQIDIGGVQVSVLFLTLLLQLPGSKHHVDNPMIFAEATLALW